MEHVSFLTDFAVVLGVAALTGLLFRRLHQPAILGYLVAGLIVGPYLPVPLFADVERTRALSEFGVVLVMFAVGLEFSLARVAAVIPVAGIAALVQITALLGVGTTIGRVLGMSAIESFFLGGSIAISSTMVVAKVFEERPPDKDVRSFVFGVLVLQDLAAILLLAAVTALAGGGGLSASELLDTSGRLAGVLAVATIAGLLVIPRAVRWIAAKSSSEVLVVFTLGLCFVLSAGAERLRYSPALGAFLAGMLVAESGRAKRVEQLVVPTRDIFAAVFFASVGMTVDPIAALHNLPLSLCLALTIVVLQFTTITAAGLLSGVGLRRSVQAGLALGQIGEFGFIIIGVGTAAGLVAPELFTVIVTTAVITAFTTPLAVRLSPRVASVLENRLPARLRHMLGMYEAWLDALRREGEVSERRRRVRRLLRILALEAVILAAIIIGVSATFERSSFALAGALPISPSVAAVLVVSATALVCFPFARGLSRAARRLGMLLGEAVFPTQAEGGTDLVTTSRRALSVVMQLTALVAVGVPITALVAPFLPTGLAFLALVLLLVPTTVYLWRSAEDLQEHVRSAAGALVEALRKGIKLGDEPVIDDLMHGLGDVVQVELPPDAPAVGKTLGELNLRVATGATVLMIARVDGGVAVPSGHDRLAAGDTLGLAGADDAIARARAFLLEGDHEHGRGSRSG